MRAGLFLLALGCAAAGGDTPAPNVPAEADGAALVLPIPARKQAPESPPSGWCGETTIQEGLLHFGVWAPQALINAAGKPVHPDLYSNEMPVALSALGVSFTPFPANRPGYAAFLAWSKKALDAGDPVIGGVKILPTQHPEWDLDHFVTVIGYGERGLLVNTTWGTREWVADGGDGLSFHRAAWGLRLRGVKLPEHAVAARLAVLEETADEVKLRATCRGLADGARYRLERRKRAADSPEWSEELVADAGSVADEVTIAANHPARFDCLRL